MRALAYVVLPLLCACGNQRRFDLSEARRAAPFAQAEPAMAPAPAPPAAPAALETADAFGPSNRQGPASVASYWAVQKLIRSGDLHIQVRHVRDAMRAADSIGKARGAFLADTRVSQDGAGRDQADLVFRVPSDRFVETMSSLHALGDVRGEVANTQDITKEYADLETRLGVKQETVTRLRELLTTRTAKLADVLEVERELARTVTELEQLEGEKRYYDQVIAISSISLALTEPAPTRVYALSDAVRNAFRGSVETLGLSLAGLVYGTVFLVPWTMVAIVLWWIVSRTDLVNRLRLRRKFRPAVDD